MRCDLLYQDIEIKSLKITILNYVWSKVADKDQIGLIKKCLGYKIQRKVQGGYALETILEDRSFIHGGSGRFLTGFIPRVLDYCKLNDIPVEINEIEKLLDTPLDDIFLPGIQFRNDQLEMLKTVRRLQRGQIKAATGTGKTIVAGGICSIWPQSNVLFLCHTIDLLQQSYKAFINDFKFPNVIMLGGGSKQQIDRSGLERSIVIATRQTWAKQDYLEYLSFFDIIIVDECHHIRKKDSQYTNFLESSLAPCRIGLSASSPKQEQDKMLLEGYIGPIIGEFTIQEGVEKGILSKPIIELLNVPYSDSIALTERYKDVWVKDQKTGLNILVEGMNTRGIVKNNARNRMILSKAKDHIDKGESVLILSSRNTKEHGIILSEMARDVFDLDIPFIYGGVKKQDRPQVQQALEDKRILAVIANIVWFEGINIKSVNAIINGAGGKSQIDAEQILGRGTRTTLIKSTFKFYDFLDPYRYLDHHCIMRLRVYSELGWLKWND